MTVSPRLTRAALTFLLFGTVSALLPSQNTTALADVVCSSNSQYVMRLTTTFNTSELPNPLPIPHTTAYTVTTQVSQNNRTSFLPATTSNFSGRTLNYTLTNTSTVGQFNIGSSTSSNPVDPGKILTYDIPSYSTGLHATKAGMTGTLTVTFIYKGITMVDNRNLLSQ